MARLIFGLLALALVAILPTRADAQVHQRSIVLRVSGVPIHVDVFEPEGGPRPAVILLHGAEGLSHDFFFYARHARAVSEAGFVVFVPHYFERTSTSVAKRPDILHNFTSWLGVVGAVIVAAQHHGGVCKGRVGLVGFSLGGALALDYGARADSVSAVVEYFGKISLPYARDAHLPPTLILHGARDRLVNVAEAHRVERILKSAGTPFEIVIYPAQGHGFIGADAVDARRRTVTFLQKWCRP